VTKGFILPVLEEITSTYSYKPRETIENTAMNSVDALKDSSRRKR
jgi:hypothetical protein